MTLLFSGVGLYMVALFLIAQWGDRGGRRLLGTGWAYGVSLAVYCTSWTYYGSVGKAANTGLLFLTIYLGPLLTSFFYPELLGRLTRLKRHYSVTSLADLLSVRYGKSLGIGAFATLATVIGIIPYISLQLKAIHDTTAILLPEAPLMRDSTAASLVTPGVLFAFTILFGLRKINPLERHPGMILALVTECVFKLLAMMAVGAVAWRLLQQQGALVLRDGWADFSGKKPFLDALTGTDTGTWICYLALAASASLFLPRQFQVAVVENQSHSQIRTASWVFPLYLFLINLPVLPIAFAGVLLLGSSAEPDYFVLTLPQNAGADSVTLAAYLGGFASATGMVMIETMAVATMASNNLILPAIRKRVSGSRFNNTIVLSRWAAAAVLILGAWAYGNALGGRYGLVSIGMISFAAIFQFVPAVLGGLFWRGGNRAGAWAGLSLGFGVWLYALFVPAILKSYWPDHFFLTEGPWGQSWLRPSSLFGIESGDPFTVSCAVAFALNTLGYVLVSMASQPDRQESADVEEFMRASVETTSSYPVTDTGDSSIPVKEKRAKIEHLLSAYMRREEAELRADGILKDLHVRGTTMSLFQLAEIHTAVERALAATMGAANAHAAMEQSEIFTEAERSLLSGSYAELIARMKISPRDLLRRVNFYQEREQILKQQTKDLERQVAEKSSLLVESSKFVALGQMAGGIAHEINSPLLIIGLSSEQLSGLAAKEEEISKEAVKTITARIDHTVRRIAKIVQGLRSFARQDGGKSDRKAAPVATLVDDALSLCQERFRNNGVKLDVIHENRDQKLLCNDVQIVQVILNLLNNAFDATEKLENRWVRLETGTGSDGNIRIRVTDCGAGIPKDVAERLFTPFFTTKEVGKGTGLGLSISKGIAEKHGGTLEVDHSFANTSFVLTLPAGAAQGHPWLKPTG